MPIFELTRDAVSAVPEVSLAEAGFKERADLQRLLRSQIDVIAPDTLVIAEEFGEWQDSHRRIDLLGVDRDANLVVIELKRTNDGGHMELQAIRYAAMVSTMTFDRAVEIYQTYLAQLGQEGNARESLLDFLGWPETDDDQFAQQVRIVLAAADFSTEITSSVLWLNSQGLDIRCVRMKPYRLRNQTLLDVQQLLPLPEAADYQVKFREKQRKERASRDAESTRLKFDVTIGNQTENALPARTAILKVVKHLADSGIAPEEILAKGRFRPFRFRQVTGQLDSEAFVAASRNGTRPFDYIRFFCADDELIYANGSTYAFSNQWTGDNVAGKLRLLAEAFPAHGIRFTAHPA